MPIRVIDLEKGSEKTSLRGKLLEFLKTNPELAFSLKEIYEHFLDIDRKGTKIYQNKKPIFYRMIYNYLRDFSLSGFVIHRGNYYYYSKKRLNGK